MNRSTTRRQAEINPGEDLLLAARRQKIIKQSSGLTKFHLIRMANPTEIHCLEHDASFSAKDLFCACKARRSCTCSSLAELRLVNKGWRQVHQRRYSRVRILSKTKHINHERYS